MSRRRAYARILRYYPRYARALGLGAVCVLASRLLLVAAPRWLRTALNALQEGGDGTLGRATHATWIFLGVSAAGALFTWAQRRLLVGASRRVERDLKEEIFRHVERLPIPTFDRTRTGDLLSRLTSDVEAVRFTVGPGIMYVGSTLVMFPLALASMIDISWRVAVIALVPLLAIMAVVRAIAPSIMRRSRAVQERIGDLSARAQESFAGARVVRAYATEPLEVEAFARANDALVRETLGLAAVRAWLTAGLYVLGGLAELVVLVWGGRLVMQGDLKPGDLAAFLAYVGMLVWPMISVGWVVSAFQRSAAAIERIDEVLRQPLEPDVLAEPAVRVPTPRGALRVQRLTFTYPGSDRPSLRDVSFEVPAGDTLALVGPVGGGKSTVLALLTRLQDPPPGTVFLDDVDVGRIPTEDLRRAFAVVPQDAFLFSDTLLGNLEYARAEGLDEATAREAAHVAGLETDLAAFPRGLQTMVGERGVTLSGGQKQRMTLARALLREAPVLCLDDALSSVDTDTEARILDRIRGELSERTVVVVAHRLSTVRDADRIVVLDDGRVRESGTHDELLAAGGWYARTWQEQRLEEELEDLA